MTKRIIYDRLLALRLTSAATHDIHTYTYFVKVTRRRYTQLRKWLAEQVFITLSICVAYNIT